MFIEGNSWLWYKNSYVSSLSIIKTIFGRVDFEYVFIRLKQVTSIKVITGQVHLGLKLHLVSRRIERYTHLLFSLDVRIYFTLHPPNQFSLFYFLLQLL
jgi:hypothetical protein